MITATETDIFYLLLSTFSSLSRLISEIPHRGKIGPRSCLLFLQGEIRVQFFPFGLAQTKERTSTSLYSKV